MSEPGAPVAAAAPAEVAAAPAATEPHAKRPHPGSSPVLQPARTGGGSGGSGGGGGGHARRQKPPKKKLKGGKRLKAVTDGSAEEVLLADVQALLKALTIEQDREHADREPVLYHGSHGEAVKAAAAAAAAADATDGAEAEGQLPEEDLPAPGTEIELDVVDLSSTGEGLAVQRKAHDLHDGPQRRRRRRVYVVSFSVPGDVVRARVYRHLPQPKAGPGEDERPPTYSVADFVEVVRPSAALRDPLGDANRVRCGYFGRCSGCQYQMLDYGEQLRIKQRVVERAYRHFSQLPRERVPAVLDTMPSPLQYGYRTKLTPHFDGPPGFRRKNKGGVTLTAVPDIGFMAKAGSGGGGGGGGARATLDIEHCPIGTPAVAAGMTRERARVARDFATYQRGATILLRESTKRYPRTAAAAATAATAAAAEGDDTGACPPPPAGDDGPDAVRVETDAFTDIKTCITDNNATSTEYVDDYVFTNPAGSFFQNNNSILPALTAYVRANVVRPAAADGAAAASPRRKALRYLIDAYSGSGLFTITLASTLPGGSVGIDIAEQSIAYARANAQLNRLAPERCRFLAADAAQLFQSVIAYDPDETVVVLDPPRKGCDAPFLRQLLAFAPARIVYVSCNVHTQARDVGMLVRGHVDWGRGGGAGAEPGAAATAATAATAASAAPATPARYEIESLRGFDFFPQTAHVEGIAVLNRADLV